MAQTKGVENIHTDFDVIVIGIFFHFSVFLQTRSKEDVEPNYKTNNNNNNISTKLKYFKTQYFKIDSAIKLYSQKFNSQTIEPLLNYNFDLDECICMIRKCQ